MKNSTLGLIWRSFKLGRCQNLDFWRGGVGGVADASFLGGANLSLQSFSLGTIKYTTQKQMLKSQELVWVKFFDIVYLQAARPYK
jgi:hypothetical protein